MKVILFDDRIPFTIRVYLLSIEVLKADIEEEPRDGDLN